MKIEILGRSCWDINKNDIFLQKPAQASSLGPLLMAIDTTGSPPTVRRVSNYFQG